jgi:hypothetical protein
MMSLALQTPYVAIVQAEPGQGKTSMALETCSQLRGSLGEQAVGGFCLLAVYRKLDDAFHVTEYVAHLFRTGEEFTIATRNHRRRRGDPEFRLDPIAVERLLDVSRQDLVDPRVLAFILDEVGPVLAPQQGRERPGILVLLEELLDHPRTINVIFMAKSRTWNTQAAKLLVHEHRSRLHATADKFTIKSTTFRALSQQLVRNAFAWLHGPSGTGA